MKHEHISIPYTVYDDDTALQPSDAQLLEKARAVCEEAYAPYSNFKVGAVALLGNGTFVAGTNQENAAFPVGMCAERTLLGAVSATAAAQKIISIAISYKNMHGGSGSPISPCGMCRQALAEWQSRQNQPLRLILAGQTGPVYIIGNAASLLPLAFTADFMKP
jgi:cytidine deaminase